MASNQLSWKKIRWNRTIINSPTAIKIKSYLSNLSLHVKIQCKPNNTAKDCINNISEHN